VAQCDEDVDGEQHRQLLLSRVRSVAFAALGAGVTEAELAEALQVAVDADARRTAAWAELATVTPRPRHLALVSRR
jgi:hypothetical protein